MIDHLLKQDCDIVKIEKDRYGDTVESDPISTKCRAEEKFELIKDNEAEEVVSSVTFWFNPDVDLSNDNVDDRKIKFNDESYTPISVQDRINTLGESVFKVVKV